MRHLRYRINPKNFVITLNQIAKHLQINPDRILNWEKWHGVLWVHIAGVGGYFISYRKLEQWLAVCRQLIRWSPDLLMLAEVWELILQESQRYTDAALSELELLWQQKQAKLTRIKLGEL